MKYTIFGRMIDGDETLDAIEKVLIDPKGFRMRYKQEVKGKKFYNTIGFD